MKNIYKPILFSTPMVQAILEDRKNQTRRTKGLDVINLNPDKWSLLTSFDNPEDQQSAFYFKNGKKDQQYLQFKTIDKYLDVKGPYQVGDIIWVRETFTEWPKGNFQFYASTALGNELGKWKPSIHMPKKACRIFLKVKFVKIERLNDISESDSIMEGINMRISFVPPFVDRYQIKGLPNLYNSAKEAFKSLWLSINGKESWKNNPFVWVIEFERIEKPDDFIE